MFSGLFSGAASQLASPARSDAATGLINDLELAFDAGVGPFMLVVTADADTIDLTTGAAPAVTTVKTIITQAQFIIENFNKE